MSRHDHDDHDHSALPHPRSVGIARTGSFDAPAFERAIGDLLRACGVDADTSHTGRTAQRVRELWQKRLLGGYDLDPAEVLGDGFEDERRDMVVVRGIAVHGVCPHHLVPFRGVAHVAYLPGGRLHGFGRIARLVDAIGHRFTYQEWMTRDIADLSAVNSNAPHRPATNSCAPSRVEAASRAAGEATGVQNRLTTRALCSARSTSTTSRPSITTAPR
ncbi:MAG: cyclohydrolase [Thauera sp.]|nr:cyclohydrolase [Thauera sp.]